MKYKEYGEQNDDVIILLHGGGLSWWNYRDQAELLKDRYHIILPILDGHSKSDRHFTSIEDNASEIIEFIDSSFKGRVLLIGGLSLGGQILLDILSQRKDICGYALVESALVKPSGVTGSLLKPTVSMSHWLIRRKSFALAQFRSLRIRDELFTDYYRDTCKIEKDDLIAFLKQSVLYSLKDSIRECEAKVHIYAGARDNLSIIKSANMIADAIPASSLVFLPDLYHGQFSLNHPNEYADTIIKITCRN